MKKIILIRGISGSGKTTRAKEICATQPNFIRLNRDNIREMMKYNQWDKHIELIVKEMEMSALKSALNLGKNVVIDDVSNLNPKTIELIKTTIKDGVTNPEDVEIIYEDCFIPLEECIKRDSLRENPIGKDIIKKQYLQYRSEIIKREASSIINSSTKRDDLPHCIIVDIDCTVSINADNRPWWGEEAEKNIINDLPITPIIKIIENYNDQVIFSTGREGNENMIKVTKEWINKHISLKKEPIYLFRSEGDYCKGDESKYKNYCAAIKDKYHIDFVLEDSPSIVKMYRNLGLIVLQPNSGIF